MKAKASLGCTNTALLTQPGDAELCGQMDAIGEPGSERENVCNGVEGQTVGDSWVPVIHH